MLGGSPRTGQCGGGTTLTTLELLREQRSRGFLEFGAGPWFRHEPRGLTVLETLASTLAANTRFPARYEHLEEISIRALITLAKAVARTRDDQTLKAVVDAYARHPKAEVIAATGWRFGRTTSESMAAVLPRRLTPWLVSRSIESPDPAAKDPAAQAALRILARAVVLKECRDDFGATNMVEEQLCRDKRLPR